MEKLVSIGYDLSQEAESSFQNPLLICFRVPCTWATRDVFPLPKLDVVYNGVDYHRFGDDAQTRSIAELYERLSMDGWVPEEVYSHLKEWKQRTYWIGMDGQEVDRGIPPVEELMVDEALPPYLYSHAIDSQMTPSTFFHGTTDYSVVYKESTEEFFFVGGYRFPRLYKSDVWVCNLQRRTWYRRPSMKRPRGSPTAFHFSDDIYVFGSSRFPNDSSDMITTSANFAEYYNSADDAWSYLPPAPKKVVKSEIVSHALDDKNGIVYFWLSDCCAHSYNIHTKRWSRSPFVDVIDGQICHTTFHPYHGVRWNTLTVFWDSFVLWFNSGTIYGYNIKDQLFVSICTLPELYWREISMAYDLTCNPPPSYLLKVGDDKLCLIYTREIGGRRRILYCHTFGVQYDQLPHIEHLGCHTFEFEGFEVESVHAINPCNEQIKRKIFKISRKADATVLPNFAETQMLMRMSLEGPYPEPREY